MSVSNITAATGHMDMARHAILESEFQAVNKDFEVLLLRELVKSMRKTVPNSGLFSSETGQAMSDYLVENALSECLAKGRGLGIDKLLQQPPLEGSGKK
jgi:Rod binding domain-containing protein